MLDPFSSSRPEIDIRPGFKLHGRVDDLFTAEGNDFQTQKVSSLTLTLEGIPGDIHAGHARKSGGREPWYERGTAMRNERQLSILSQDELRAIARRLAIPSLECEWIGGNLLLSGIPSLTLLPPRTLLMFEGGVTIKVDGDNAPCRVAGKAIQAQFPGRTDIETQFAKQAEHLRGLVGWVEKEGVVHSGEAFTARVPRQWIYEPS